MRVFIGIVKDERGATAVEYGRILALVCLAMVGAVSQVAGVTIEMWNDISNHVAGS